MLKKESIIDHMRGRQHWQGFANVVIKKEKRILNKSLKLIYIILDVNNLWIDSDFMCSNFHRITVLRSF